MSEKLPVSFGTDGWRGVIADDFTFENVRLAARAIANYVLAHPEEGAGVCIGWDTRFGSQRFARTVAEVLAGAGIPVQLAHNVTPTPALMTAVAKADLFLEIGLSLELKKSGADNTDSAEEGE